MLKRNCVVCGKETTNKLCCSNECRGKYCGQKYSGVNNPNYGKTWSADKREQQSKKIKSLVDDVYRQKCSSGNKGKTFSKERIDSMHAHRDSSSYSRPHSEETKEIIGRKSAEKFKSEEFSQKFRKSMEQSGNWLPLDQRSEYSLYFAEANWNEPLFDKLYDSYPIIEEVGVFNTKTNTKGVVRDHRLSRKSGFELGVPPEILRHIENCDIILHADNVRKNVSKSISSDSLTLEDLFTRIENTKHDWHEQELCLKLIKEYKNGKSWRKEAKCVSEPE